ncbi:unnamed protein product [Symbiodinium sp. CCMP2592]|nr:unnamed protein product [Symbiodinium sp. CCMP2592]
MLFKVQPGGQSDSGIGNSFSSRVVDTSVLAGDPTLQKKRPRRRLSIATSLQSRLLRSVASPSLPQVLQTQPNTGKPRRNASKHKQVHSGDAAPVFGKGHSQETQRQSAPNKLSGHHMHGGRRETSQMQGLLCWPRVASESKANVGASLKLVLDLVCQRQMKAGQTGRNEQSHCMPGAYPGFLPCCTELLTVTLRC